MLRALVGVWVGWKASFTVDTLYQSKNLILLSIKEISIWVGVLLSYMVLNSRAIIWETLQEVFGQQSGPLLCIGDFNQILHPSDRLGMHLNSIPGLRAFSNFFSTLALPNSDLMGHTTHGPTTVLVVSIPSKCWIELFVMGIGLLLTNFCHQSPHPWIGSLVCPSLHQLRRLS